MEKKQKRLSELTDEERKKLTEEEFSERSYRDFLETMELTRKNVRKAEKWLEGINTSDLYEKLTIIADKFEEEIDNDTTIVNREQAKHDLFFNIFTAIKGVINKAPYKIKVENYKKYVDEFREPYKRFDEEHKHRYLSNKVAHAIEIKFVETDRPRTKWKVRYGDRDGRESL